MTQEKSNLKVVTIGGGTGQRRLLQALNRIGVLPISFAPPTDSGGSSGELSREYGVPPLGDPMKCVLGQSAMAGADRLLLKRITETQCLKGLSAGNALLFGLWYLAGRDFEIALQALSEFLEAQGEVLPATLDKATLAATFSDGKKIASESAIDTFKNTNNAKVVDIELVAHFGQIRPNQRVLQAISEADYIIFASGDLYTSLIPNLLIPGIPEAISNSNANLIYILNIMTKNAETPGFKPFDFVHTVEGYLSRQLDLILANEAKLSEKVMERYRAENAEQVLVGEKELAGRVLKMDLLSVDSDGFVRHDAEKLASAMETILFGRNK